MSQRHASVDELLDDLREALAVEPSLNLENRIRIGAVAGARWDARRSPRTVARRSLVLIGSISLLATGIFIVAGVSSGAGSSSALPEIRSVARTASPAGVLPVPGAEAGHSGFIGAARELERVAVAGSEVQSRDQGFEVIEVIVPPDQLQALTRLLAIMRQKGMAWTPGPSTAAVVEPLPDPEPVDIPLIKIEPLPALSPVLGEGKQP